MDHVPNTNPQAASYPVLDPNDEMRRTAVYHFFDALFLLQLSRFTLDFSRDRHGKFRWIQINDIPAK